MRNKINKLIYKPELKQLKLLKKLAKELKQIQDNGVYKTQ